MTREEFDARKPELLEIMSNLSPMEPHKLFERLTIEADLDDSQARSAIWRLLDDGDIRLTLDRKFEVAVPQA